MNFAEDFLPLFAACYLYNYCTGTTPLCLFDGPIITHNCTFVYQVQLCNCFTLALFGKKFWS